MTFLKAGEQALADRVVTRFRARAREIDPNCEIIRVFSDEYEEGRLGVESSPSLFGEAKLLEFPDFENANDALMIDLKATITTPQPDVWILVRRNGGNKGAGLLKMNGVEVIDVPAVKKPEDKLRILTQEVHDQGGRISREGAVTLIEALGDSVGELLAAAQQLAADVEGEIDREDVLEYYSDRYVAGGFAVADALVGRDTAGALQLLRYSRQAGNDDSATIGALVYRFRQFVAAMDPRGVLADQLNISPWLMKKISPDLRRWGSEDIAFAFTALARADAQVKGGAVAKDYPLEKAIIDIIAHKK
ncbi:MAG: hypothetical protein SOS98_07135 [Varibaculum sp.]|nr:hypothetical protein [Varibaculum sp.]